MTDFLTPVDFPSPYRVIRTALATTGMLLTLSAAAQSQLFTDRTAWEAAVGASSIEVIDLRRTTTAT